MQIDLENRLVALAYLFAAVLMCVAEENTVINGGNSSGNLVEDAVVAFERLRLAAQMAAGKKSPADIKNLVEPAIKPAESILHLMKDLSNVYRFIEAKGFERVILPHLHIPSTELRGHLLSLIKVLFDRAPTTTTVMIPVEVVDKLIEIFEDDDNLVLKSKTIDILYVWLPNNPKAQSRVMELKGLEPFYSQARKFDVSAMHTQLKLLSKIIKEHIQATDDSKQRSTIDDATQAADVYKKIGLIERISNAKMCLGFVDIYHSIWNSPAKDKFMTPVFAILTDLQPHCVGHYKNSKKALKLFQELLKHVKEGGQTVEDHFEEQELDITETATALEAYVNQLSPREEL